jgi:hypothetical protein
MDKEREPIFTDGGFSEKQMDKAVDQGKQNDKTKAGNIFDPKKKLNKSGVILDSQNQDT